MTVLSRRSVRFAALASSLALTLAACGGSDESSGNSGGSGSAVDLEAASEFLGPFQEPPTEFPITEPLQQAMPPETQVMFLQAATTVSSAQNASLAAAAEVMGVQYDSIEVGGTAQSVGAALDSVVELQPDVVINVTVDPILFSSQLEALRAAGTVVVSSAIVNGEEFGFDTVLNGTEDVEEIGRLMAASALVDGKGEFTNFVFYKTPELAFTTVMERQIQAALDEFCQDCELRVVDIPITEVGSTAQNIIVSDLQANPDTDVTLASFDEIYLGLQSGLEVAGIDVQKVGQAPVESSFQAIADGHQYATVAWDLDIQMWGLLDQAAREMAGQELTPFHQAALVTKNVITQENLPEDFAVGFEAFPDDREQFAALWGRPLS